ncbi:MULTISPECIES: ATP-grasp domain-containing protein [unclassified Psychrobacter]|uniref:ATP-grasp domain-containing protein n=1 Tax=unclassified Psychrobacter TaxID=196806 RepID=UPI00071E76E5|nr:MULTISPECIES: hypothetical protein [unclassified Psychrobacter]OLF37465.1 hypothetical protein BTV98_07530 [Psychrobacter sp. Cmf 22.2]
MKVAIHHRPGSFSDRWIEYCKNKNIDYKLVNAFDTDIIEQLKGYDVFMWHHHHSQIKDVLAAKNILFAIEHSGLRVFPDFKTNWHFDNKVAQKYLLEAAGIPIVPSYIFYDKKQAKKWAKNTSYPKVFKLTRGAGSSNVKLARSKSDAVKFINKSFGKGFPQLDRVGYLKEALRKSGKDTLSVGSLTNVLKGVTRFVFNSEFAKKQSPERDYAYFQDFIENKGFDVRVVVIDNRAVALKRMVRENDFRASGSGNLVFDNEKIDKRYIELAFNVSDKLQTQSLAIDLIHGIDDEIRVVEMSYGFPMLNFLERSAGYWDKDINWHESDLNLQNWIIEGLLRDK